MFAGGHPARNRVVLGTLAVLAVVASACGPQTIPLPPPPSPGAVAAPAPHLTLTKPTPSQAPPSPHPTAKPPHPDPDPMSPPAQTLALSPVDAFSGLGTWVDIFEKAYRHPTQSVQRMHNLGVRTIYLQTSNFTRPAIRFPGRLGQFIELAHDRDMLVIGWYLPGLENMPADLHKSLKAIRYTSPDGEQLDGFGVDIEAAEVRRHKLRSARLLMHSRQLRDAVGPTYPLGAITPMPVRLAQAGSYWRDFPYAGLTEYYDAILPMNYFTYDVSGERGTWRYTVRGIDLIRQGTGNPTFPIHVIGGISGAMSPEETRGFMRAVQEGGAVGWSLYNYSLTPAWMWPDLQPAPPPA